VSKRGGARTLVAVVTGCTLLGGCAADTAAGRVGASTWVATIPPSARAARGDRLGGVVDVVGVLIAAGYPPALLPRLEQAEVPWPQLDAGEGVLHVPPPLEGPVDFDQRARQLARWFGQPTHLDVRSWLATPPESVYEGLMVLIAASELGRGLHPRGESADAVLLGGRVLGGVLAALEAAGGPQAIWNTLSGGLELVRTRLCGRTDRGAVTALQEQAQASSPDSVNGRHVRLCLIAWGATIEAPLGQTLAGALVLRAIDHGANETQQRRVP